MQEITLIMAKDMFKITVMIEKNCKTGHLLVIRM